jgi:hypothetical protein
MTAWRSSPAGVTIERTVVRWLAEAIGCVGFSGTLTGGGSAANLMALALARESGIPSNDRGMWAAKCLSFTHRNRCTCPFQGGSDAWYRTGKSAATILAMDRYRMIPSELNRSISADKARGRKPIAVMPPREP